MPPSQEERRLHQPPSFTASLYDLAVPASSTASNAPFVDVLQQSRLNRMQDDSSALSSLISSVLGGGGGSGVGATAPTEVASLASPAPGKQAASSPARLSPSLQSPASAPVDALASAAAVRARAQAIASNNAAVSAYAVRLNPAPRDSHAAHCGEDVRNVLSVDSIAEAVLPPNSAASIAPTERPPHSDDRNLSRPATPAALIMLDQQLQQVLASSPAPDTHATRAAFSASSHIQRGQPEGNRRAERHIHESGMREENWIPVDYVEVQASRTAEDDQFLAELDRQNHALEALLQADLVGGTGSALGHAELLSRVMQSPAHHSTLQSQPHLPLHPSFSEPAFSQPYSRVDNPHASSARGLHRRPKSDAHDEVHSQRSEPHLQHEVTQSYVLGGDNQFGDDPVEYHERSSFEYEPGPEEAADAYSHGATHDHLRRRDDEQPSAPRVSVARTTDRVMDAMRSHARALDTGYSNLNSAVARSAVSQIPLQALSVTEPLDLFRALLNAPAPSCAPPIVGHALSSSLGTALGLRVAARANMAVLHGVHAESHEVAMTPRDFARAKVPVACALAAARLHPHSPAAPHFVMSRSGVDSSEDLAAEDAVVQHAHRKFVSALQNRLPLGGAGAAAPVRSMASDAQVVPSVRRHKARTLRQPSRRK